MAPIELTLNQSFEVERLKREIDAQTDAEALRLLAFEAMRDIAHLLRPGKDGAAPDFFGPTPAPARFVSTSVAVDPKDKTKAVITGDLTLNGVTKPVTFEAEFVGAGQNPFNKKATVGFEAETQIKRSDFAVNYGIPFVSDAVELDISAAFEKQ